MNMLRVGWTRGAVSATLLLISVGIVGIVIGAVRLRATSQLVSVLSPNEGQIFRPGELVEVQVMASEGVTVRSVSLNSTVKNIRQESGAPIRFVAPGERLGPVVLLIIVRTEDGRGTAVERTIRIESADAPVSLDVAPARVNLVYPSSSAYYPGLTVTQLTVTARYPDGLLADITGLGSLEFRSGNPSVATVDNVGVVRAVAPGRTTIAVGNGTASANAVVQVNIFELRGDLDGDNDVDQDDLGVVTAALNRRSTGPGDPRDLNNDGIINALDSRILVNLCSRARCARD